MEERKNRVAGWRETDISRPRVLSSSLGQMIIDIKYLPSSFKYRASAECHDGSLGLRVTTWFQGNPQVEVQNRVRFTV